ncbi:uncharacterized protein LTR77_002559 [Saxophila tyrrhenica]|uniref:Uncharacterized protein n=1 Tax=Saxophila tyrrhenica TaxID=1690608 RepID=A0AAV9PMF9_9PEZI|nr:hypothetical protein LTR77_002559 [Saxophila tyrrhenica]
MNLEEDSPRAVGAMLRAESTAKFHLDVHAATDKYGLPRLAEKALAKLVQHITTIDTPAADKAVAAILRYIYTFEYDSTYDTQSAASTAKYHLDVYAAANQYGDDEHGTTASISTPLPISTETASTVSPHRQQSTSTPTPLPISTAYHDSLKSWVNTPRPPIRLS